MQITCKTCDAAWSERKLPGEKFEPFDGSPCVHVGMVGKEFSNETGYTPPPVRFSNAEKERVVAKELAAQKMDEEFLTRAIQAAHAGMIRLFVRADGDGRFFAKDDNGLVFMTEWMKPEGFFTKRIAARSPVSSTNY
jgi:hypothetical protein